MAMLFFFADFPDYSSTEPVELRSTDSRAAVPT
jgi:hypothetical protein